MSNGNGSVAPVCPISRSQAPSGQPGILVPAVPRATDLPSAINVINQLVQIVNTMMNPPAPNLALTINNSAPYPIPRWAETKRVITPVRIYNPNDKSQWIDIDRISSVSFKDNVTNGLLQWNYVNKALKQGLP